MMLCPACHQVYDQDQRFCEEDGTQLVTMPPVVNDGHGFGRFAASQTTWVSGAVGVVVGLSVAVGGVGIYSALTDRPETPAPLEQNKITAAPAKQQTRPPADETSATSPPAEEDDVEEPAPESSPTPSMTPAPVSSPTATPSGISATLISTGAAKVGNDSAKISFNDGSSIEADDIWEDAKGIWYRRGGLVTFVERERVSVVERLTAAQKRTPEAKPEP